MSNIIWKDLKGYEGIYKISNKGDIIKLATTTVNSLGVIRKHKEKTLSTNCKNGHYKSVGICGVTKYVHRLVAESFIPNVENKKLVNHKDGNKLNNSVDNLEWVTYKENTDHAWKLGLINCRGSNSKHAKLNESQVKEIKELLTIGELTHGEIATKYKVCRQNISYISAGKRWKHV